MAIANKRKARVPKEYELVLEDGQKLIVYAVRGGQTVGDERELEQVSGEMSVIQGRLEHLRNQAVTAVSDQEYQKALANMQRFQRKFADIEPRVDKTLLLVLTDWEMCLTTEDEAAGLFVPLTEEGLASLDRDLKFDVFGKLMEKFKEGEEEKKDSAESTRDGTQVKAKRESAPDSISTMN